MVRVIDLRNQSLIDRVIAEGQEQVFRWWDELSEMSRENLLEQLRSIDFDLLNALRKKCSADKQRIKKPVLEPVQALPIPNKAEEIAAAKQAREIGEAMLRSGKVAVFLVAGGQGTRLGFHGPKGCFPIGPVSGKSLFQIHAEKILAHSRAYGVPIPWYIMTSETNDTETRQFFQRNKYFNLKSDTVHFFKQRMIPALDETGKLILDRKDHIFMSPNGHGGSLLALSESGALSDMEKRGIEIISYFQVDNVLIRMIDPVFIGYHVQAKAEMSSKMLRKRNPQEKVGLFGRVNGRLTVIEYSDMSEDDKKAKNPDGSLKYGAGSIAIHLINVDFVQHEVTGGFKLPYHVTHKKIPHLDEMGEQILPDEPNGFKFEAFVFDALKDTSHSIVMEVVREDEFSPVKNKDGVASPETAKRDLSNFFGRWLESADISVSRDDEGNVEGAIEIHPLFARNKEEFLNKGPHDYIFEGSLFIDAH
ncbi:UTP--glucose-1-phosphate uridylyltransferase [bacterium]